MELPLPDQASCERVRALVREFVAGREHVAERARVRAHLATCGACADDYKALVEAVALLGRAVRTRDDRHKHKPRDVTRTDGAELERPSLRRAEEPPTPLRGRRNFLAPTGGVRIRVPKFLMVCALIAVVIAIANTGREEGDVRVQALAGAVELAGVALVDETAAVRGVSLVTGESGRASIECDGNRAILGPHGALRVERIHDLALRIYIGTLSIEGDARLVTPLGVVETRGARVEVELDESGLQMSLTSGAASLVDRSGTHGLAHGETRRFEFESTRTSLVPRAP